MFGVDGRVVVEHGQGEHPECDLECLEEVVMARLVR